MYQHALARCLTDEQRAAKKKVTASQLVSWKILSLFRGYTELYSAGNRGAADVQEPVVQSCDPDACI